MVYGQSMQPEFIASYYVKMIDNARKQLTNYPTLGTVLGNLNSFKTQKINNPLIINLAYSGGKFNKSSLSSIPGRKNWLMKVENTLSIVIPKLSKNQKQKNELFSKLSSNQGNQYAGALAELQVFEFFIDVVGYDKFNLFPKVPNGKNAEMELNIDQPTIIEVTEVYQGKTQNSLEALFNDCAKTLSHKIEKKIILKLEVDTSKLDWTPYLDHKKSKEKIIFAFDNLGLIAFKSFPGFYSLDDISNLDNTPTASITTSRNKQYLQYYGDLGEFLFKHISDPSFLKFFSIAIQKINENPIRIVQFCPGTHGLVEVHAKEWYPSVSASKEQKAFINQIKRKISSKIDENQMDPTKSNILVIQAFNFTTWGYSSDAEQEMRDLEFEEIKKGIEETLEIKKNTSLSAVVIFEQNLPQARIIKNPYCTNHAVPQAIEQLFS